MWRSTAWASGSGRLARSSSIRAGLAQRARIVLLAADGVTNTEIAERVGVARQTVISWRDRYASSGTKGLEDEQRSGRPRTVDRAKILAATLTIGRLIGGTGDGARRSVAGVVASGSFVVLAVLAFAYFWPIWTYELLTHREWQMRMWFRRWI